MSANNSAHLKGRIPFDLELKGSEGKEFIGFSISVRRNYKPEGEQYYPEDLIYCKAFRGTAKFIANNFAKGQEILIVGEIRRDDDYTPDGATEPVKGQLYFNVEDATFCGSKNDNGGSAPADSAPKTPAAGAKKPLGGAAKPTPGAKGSNPLAGGSKPGAKRPF